MVIGNFADDLDLGKQKAKMCVACHGINGLSKSDDIPSLLVKVKDTSSKQWMNLNLK